MMTHIQSLRLFGLLAFGALCSAEPAHAQLATDMKLEDAGFVMRRADTPEKMAQLRKLPPRKFATRVGQSGRYYLWADPESCQCVFVGTERALQAFRDMRRAALPQPDNVPASGPDPMGLMMHDMDMDAGINVPNGDVLDYQF
jgi:hypothetical protein